MKKILIVFFLSILIIPVNADELMSNSIQLNTFQFVYWIGFPASYRMSLEYQHAINNLFNLSFEPHFTYVKIGHYEEVNQNHIFLAPETNINNIDTGIYNYGNTFGLLYRPHGRRLKGMYLGIYLDLSITHRSYQKDYFIGLGNKFEIGYQWVFKNGFTVALGGNIFDTIYIPLNDSKYSYRYSILGTHDIPVSLRISTGYSF
jgi:hypothetical protein